MITFEINCDEFSTRNEVADTLREIANRIDEGYVGGMTNSGASWGIDGREAQADDEDEDRLFQPRHLKIGQRVYNCDPNNPDLCDYGIVKLIHSQERDDEFFWDSVILLKMEESGSENETYGENIYIIDEKKSAEIGETVCFEHLNNGYDYYMPSNDCNYMLGELIGGEV